MSARSAILLAALATVGCTWGAEPPPSLTGVSPVALTRGATSVLTVSGGGFHPSFVVDFDSASRFDACVPYRVELRTPGAAPIPLDRVRLISPTEVRARLDGSATVSAAKTSWDVVLVDPLGGEATLPNAFQITGCPGTACDDGEDACTTSKLCNGSSRCSGTPVPNLTACTFACPTGAPVEGYCETGACLPRPGLCDPLPICTPP